MVHRPSIRSIGVPPLRCSLVLAVLALAAGCSRHITEVPRAIPAVPPEARAPDARNDVLASGTLAVVSGHDGAEFFLETGRRVSLLGSGVRVRVSGDPAAYRESDADVEGR